MAFASEHLSVFCESLCMNELQPHSPLGKCILVDLNRHDQARVNCMDIWDDGTRIAFPHDVA